LTVSFHCKASYHMKVDFEKIVGACYTSYMFCQQIAILYICPCRSKTKALCIKFNKKTNEAHQYNDSFHAFLLL
jgi:hypothetical protein